MKYKVQYTVTYETEVECDREDLADEIADLEIPETASVRYVEDTYEVDSVTDADGTEIPVEDV